MLPRRMVLVTFPDMQMLDTVGPVEVFTAADRLLGPAGAHYRVETVARQAGPVRCSSGLTIEATAAIDDVAYRPDTMLVSGGAGTDAASRDAELLAGVRALARRSRRFGSVCTGAFVLAAAGLLHGRSCTTHWSATDRLQQAFPTSGVQPDRIFVNDGPVWTSAGVTAGIDLALELVATDHGRDLAREVARWLVVYLQRPGGQSQFSVPLATTTEHVGVRELQAWMGEHLTDDLSVGTLAERMAMSERTFQRTFHRETGVTPGLYVEQLRVEHARRLLESSQLPIPLVAAASGFRSVETLYRSFRRRVDGTPADYRRHFATRTA